MILAVCSASPISTDRSPALAFAISARAARIPPADALRGGGEDRRRHLDR